MKKYCEDWTENRCRCGKLISNFCKYYTGRKDNIESCAGKCNNKESEKCLASVNGKCAHSCDVCAIEVVECNGTVEEQSKCNILA